MTSHANGEYGEGCAELVRLVSELRSERLFVASEVERVRWLNGQLERNAAELAQAAWSCVQQRSNVRQLFGNGGDCCLKMECVLSPVFVEAHRVLRYQDALVLAALVQRVRASPALACLWLTAAEAEGPGSAAQVARALAGGLHVCDPEPLRKILLCLARRRLAESQDPRRIICQGNSSFIRLYNELVDGFRPARLFLAAALRVPMLPLFQIDFCLVVDPDKVIERIKKSGSNCANNDWQAQLYEYQNWTILTLVSLVERFMNSLRELWTCFPPTIAWIVRQTAVALRANRNVSEEDIHSICTTLVFTNFICQAIVNPDAYGITDIPITNVSRFNLSQVALTVQTLCLMKYQEIDGKFRDLYSRFDRDCVYSLLDMLIDDPSFSALSKNQHGPSQTEHLYDDLLNENITCDEDDKNSIKFQPSVNPNIALLTRNDLQLLVTLLKKVPMVPNDYTAPTVQTIQSDIASNSKESPVLNLNPEENSVAVTETKAASLEKSNLDEADNIEENDTACGVSSSDADTKDIEGNDYNLCRDENFYQLVKRINPETISKLHVLLKRLPESNFESVNDNNSAKNKRNHRSPIKQGGKKNKDTPKQSQEVLIIKLPGDNTYEPIGMVSENKVLEYHYSALGTCRTLSEEMIGHGHTLPNRSMDDAMPQQTSDAVCRNSSLNGISTTEANSQVGQEKRTRFSLSHDEGSIGNTSDNLEAVSEAASNHSVTSSLEMETEDQNDNLSDMVSANVSGRGSPNISGRDTPSSQVTEGDPSGPNLQPTRNQSTAPSTMTTSKQAKLLKRTRHDIEDKFCKFEIKKLMEGDETFSILSDTWSTDVLASDSETIAESAYDRAFITPILTLSQQIVTTGSIGHSAAASIAPSQPDVSETASESAWSTDALVSDSDRMTEVDMDDCNSVTRSETETARFDTEGIPVSSSAQNYSPEEEDNANESSRISDAATLAGSLDVAAAVATNQPNDSEDYNHVLNAENASKNVLNHSDSTNNERFQFKTNRDTVDYANGIMNLPSTSSKSTSEVFNVNNVSSKGHDLNESLHKPAPVFESNTLNTQQDVFDYQYNAVGSNGSDESKNDISTPETNLNLKSPVIQIVNNGSATSRWLNDPCQIFPKQKEPEKYHSGMGFIDFDMDNFQSCTVNNESRDEINNICQNIKDLNLSDTNCMFKPINPNKEFLGENNELGNCFSNQENIDNKIKADMEENLLNGLSTAQDLAKGSGNNNDLFSDIFEQNVKEIIFINSEMAPNKSQSASTAQNESVTSKISSVINSQVNKISETKAKIMNIGSSKILKSPNKSVEKSNDSPLNEVISSGSAISLSNLSVNSVDTSTSDRSSSQDVNSENLTERRVTPPLTSSLPLTGEAKIPNINDGANTLPRQSATFYTNFSKPGPSTGAIPKSISFDATAEKSHRHNGRRMNDDPNDGLSINFGDIKNNVKRSGGNFFNKIKLFRNKSRGHAAPAANFGKRGTYDNCEDNSKLRDNDLYRTDEGNKPNLNMCNVAKSNSEISDDILAKYRRKASSSSEAATSDSTSHSGSARGRNRDLLTNCDDNVNSSDVDSAPDKHSNNDFENLRRELRLILSNMDINGMELAAGHSSSLALACALRLESAVGGPSASKALGALSKIDSIQGSLLLKALRADSAARRPYLNYLSKCRKSLLTSIAGIESEYNWQVNEVKRQGALAIAARARSSLSAKEPRLIALQEKLRSGLVDERKDALSAALQTLSSEIASEDSWKDASEWELEQANLTIERVVMGRVYRQAIFPNGEGDLMRDQLLRDHMSKLLNTSIEFQNSRSSQNIPFLPAERIINYLSVYKTPRDKVDCVVQFVKSIINLLSITTASVPGADDLIPVLVNVLIKANPPSLLSTVQFVNTFIEPPLEGEQLYCWTQFCAAIEYIKTLD